MKAVIQDHANAGSDVSCAVAFVNGGVMVDQQFFNISILGAPDVDAFMALLIAAILAYSSGQGYGLTAADIIPSSPTTQPLQADFNQATGTALDFIKNKPSVGKVFEGTTQRLAAFPIFKSVTVGSGVAVFHLTDSGLSGGNALFPNGVIADSVNAFVSDALASYQMSYAFSNSNKTLTVTANKLTTANILTGILGQSSANGAVVKLSVWGY